MHRLFRPISLAIAAVISLILYTLVGFFLVPYVIKAYVFPAVSDQLRHPVLAKEVEFNPFELALRLTGFEIQEKDGAPLIGFEEFFINVRAVSIIRRAYVFDTIRFTVPFVSVKVAKDGHVNLTDLVPPDEPAAAPPANEDATLKGEIPAVQIGRFEIAQGIVKFRDESKAKPFALDIVPINIVLNNFHTKPGGDNTYSFTAELGKGETLAWEGTISLEPIRSEGHLSLAGIKIPQFFQYVQDQFNFDVPSGTVDAKGSYRFDAASSPIDFEVSDTSVHMAAIALTEKNDPNPVISIPTFNVDGIHVDLRNRKVAIASVALADAADRVWRNPDGSINLQNLFAPRRSEPAAAPAVSSPPKPSTTAHAGERPWTVTVRDAHVTNHSIHFEDRTLSLPMRTEVTGLSIRTHDVVVPLKEPIPLIIGLTLNETGTVAADGLVHVDPFQLDMKLGLKHIAIQPFQPYVESVSRMTVDSGTIDLDGQIHLAREHPKAPLMTFRGNLGVKSLAIADRDQGVSFASWKQLQLKEFGMAVDPTAVTIEEIGLDEPVIHIEVAADGTTNLAKLRPPAEEKTEALPKPQAKTAPEKEVATSVSIKVVKLLKGAITFQDESIAPTVRTGLYDLTGTIKGLSSKQVAKADVDISGRVDRIAPLKIAGKINPLTEDAFTDLTVNFENVDLIAASSYSGKYAGYPIRKGKLFLDLAYKISNKQLEAENKVAVDQLTFGEKTNSPDAVSLPVPLAVALLKDRKGRIDIDLPIRGDLNDPDFKYGKVVWSTLLNLLTKLVASPFTLMGKLIPGGGNGEDLRFVAFQPGSGELLSAELKKLDALTKGLEERPGLRLEITGAADPARDRQALGYQNLHAQVLARWRQERGTSKEMNVPSDQEARLVKELFDLQVGQSPAPPVGATPGQPNVAAKPPTVDDMKQQLVAAMPIDESALRNLARQRAERIRQQIASEGKIAEERLFLTEVNLAASGQELVRSNLSITAGP